MFQVFFSTADENRRLGVSARNLGVESDETMMEAFDGRTSLPFAADPHKRVAVKILEERGLEVIDLG